MYKFYMSIGCALKFMYKPIFKILYKHMTTARLKNHASRSWITAVRGTGVLRVVTQQRGNTVIQHQSDDKRSVDLNFSIKF